MLTTIFTKRFLFRVFVFFAFLVMPNLANGRLYVVFRYDDLSADKLGDRETDTTRMRIWEAEKAVDGLFEKYGMSYVIAIIPNHARDGETFSFEEDQEKIDFIRRAVQAARVEVAQHGFSHINVVSSNHRQAEFRERDYKSQLRDIARGREILLNACNMYDISTFVPPWNGWTGDTARILKKLGFKILSTDRYYYYKSAIGLTVIPYTTFLGDFESMVNQHRLPEEGIIVVLYHSYDTVRFPGTQGSYYFGVERFEKLLQKLSAMQQVKVVTLQQLANGVEGLTIERYRAANSLRRQRSFWAKLLPRHLWLGTEKQGVYLAQEEYSQLLWQWRAMTAGLIAALFIMGLLVRYLFRFVFAPKWRYRIDLLAVLLFCLSILAELRLIQRGYHMTGIRAIPAFFCVSFLIGLILRIFRKTTPADAAG